MTDLQINIDGVEKSATCEVIQDVMSKFHTGFANEIKAISGTRGSLIAFYTNYKLPIDNQDSG